MKKYLSAFALLLLLMPCGYSKESALENLQAALHQIDNLQADFIQINHQGDAQADEELRGEVWLAKPDYFFWDYRLPMRQQIISDGKTVYYYDMDLQQITQRDYQELQQNGAINILNSKEDIADRFFVRSVTQLPADIRKIWNLYKGSDAIQYYQLETKNQEDTFEKVYIGMDASRHFRFFCIDAGAQVYSLFIIENAKWNQNMDMKRFHFTIPQGVDVISTQP